MLNEIGLFIVMVLSIIVLVTPGLLTLKLDNDNKIHLGIFYQKKVDGDNFESMKVKCIDKSEKLGVKGGNNVISQICTALKVVGVVQVVVVSLSFILLLSSHTLKNKYNIKLINFIIRNLLFINALCLCILVFLTGYYESSIENSRIKNRLPHKSLKFDYSLYIILATLFISVMILFDFSLDTGIIPNELKKNCKSIKKNSRFNKYI